MKHWMMGAAAAVAALTATPGEAAGFDYNYSFLTSAGTFAGQLLGVSDSGSLANASFSVTSAPSVLSGFVSNQYSLVYSALTFSNGAPTGGYAEFKLASPTNAYTIDLAAPGLASAALVYSPGTPGSGGTGSVLLSGSTQISAVPEASTWVMFITGFGVLGGALRKYGRGSFAARKKFSTAWA